MKTKIKLSVQLLLSIMALLMGCRKEDVGQSFSPLQVDSYYPNSGKGGTLVTILGDGFSTDRNQNSVTFAGVAADVLSAKPNELVVRAPAPGTSGTVVLSRTDERVEVGEYRYQALSLQRLSPPKSQIGGQINVFGEGFSGLSGPATVTINGTPANILSVLDTIMVVQVPDGSGSGPVEVTVDGMSSTGPLFTYMSIQQVSPLTGGAGTRVTITGEGFDGSIEGNIVTFNNKRALVLEAAADRLVVQVPEEVETGPVLISIAGEPIIGPDFTVVPVPGITLVTPLSGPAGTEMLIRGTTFSAEPGETRVRINGVDMTLQSVTATEIRLVLPGGTGNGPVEVIVNDQRVEGPEFRDQNLGIASFFPSNGLSGTEVIIAGTGFSNSVDENIVTFNGVQATVTAATENSLTVVAPDNLSTGVIRVSTGGTQAVSFGEFLRAGVETLVGGASSTDIQLSSLGGALALDNQGNVYALEVDHHRIMKISPSGSVSLFAGSPAGSPGNQDGAGSEALFRMTRAAGLQIDAAQNLYLTDDGNQALKRISTQGVVTTLVDNFGSAIGKSAINGNGNIQILRLSIGTRWAYSTNTGSVSSLPATITAFSHIQPALDNAEAIYYIAANTNRIVRWSNTVTLNWRGSAAAGYVDGATSAVRFNGITAIVNYDPAGHDLLVADGGNYAIRKVNTVTLETSTVLRGTGHGYQDGNFDIALFSGNITDMAISPDGNTIYVLDSGNNAVRKVYLR